MIQPWQDVQQIFWISSPHLVSWSATWWGHWVFSYTITWLCKKEWVIFPVVAVVFLAQSETQSCSAPVLLGGVFAPRQRTYSNGTVVTYICNEGLKPAVKGWSATITCENGKWSHQAQCIGKCSLNTSTVLLVLAKLAAWLHSRPVNQSSTTLLHTEIYQQLSDVLTQLCSDIQAPFWMNCSKFGDSLILHLEPSSGQNVTI